MTPCLTSQGRSVSDSYTYRGETTPRNPLKPPSALRRPDFDGPEATTLWATKSPFHEKAKVLTRRFFADRAPRHPFIPIFA